MTRRPLLALSLALVSLAAQDHPGEELERTLLRKPKAPTDVRFSVLLGVARTTDAQTQADLASGGKGAAASMVLEYPLHNHWVFGARLGGLWLRERSQPYPPAPLFTMTQQSKAFHLGFETKLFLTDAQALRGPYVAATVQWTQWKKFLGLDYQDGNYGDGETPAKVAFTPTVGLGWQITRVVGVDVRFTRSRFREEYDYFPGYTKDWNLDHLTFSLVLRGGGSHLK
jgi:hypothetical protein